MKPTEGHLVRWRVGTDTTLPLKIRDRLRQGYPKRTIVDRSSVRRMFRSKSIMLPLPPACRST